MTIVFEALTLTSGDGAASLAAITGRAYETAPTGDAAGLLRRIIALAIADDNWSAAGELPRLRSLALAQAGDYGVAVMPSVTGLASGGAQAPSVAVVDAVLPLLVGQSAGTGSSIANAASLLPRLHVLALEADGYANGSLRALTAASYQITPPASFALVLQSPGYASAYGTGDLGRLYRSLVAIGADVVADHVMVRRAMLAMGESAPQGVLEALDHVEDAITFEDISSIIWRVLCGEVASFGTTVLPWASILVEAGSALALEAGPGSVLDAFEAVAEALRIGEAAGYAFASSILESLAFAGSAAAGLLGMQAASESLSMSVQASGSASFVVLAPDGIALSDVASSTATLIDQIREGVAVLARFNLPDGQYLAWVCNTESRAFHTYRNFPFNSFFELGGHYYGATDEGIYLLEGEDDAGVPIDAMVRTGLMDLGTGLLKRMEAMYLGYRSTGQLLLKVVTTSDYGEKTESWYSLDPQPADAFREGRIKVGRGLKSLYWGFELANVDGSDFEIDTLSMLPMILERRI